MMTAEEKAKELYDKYFWTQYPIVGTTRSKITKQCALICVDEIIEREDFFYNLPGDCGAYNKLSYWQEVKSYIKLL